jgi:hypothetical protein
MPFYTFEFIVTVVFAIFWYRAGVLEKAPALLWAVLSAGLSLVIWQLLTGGTLMIILGQLGLFAAIVIVRMIR